MRKEDFMLCEKITESEIPAIKGELKANIKFDGERLSVVKRGSDVFLVNRAGREKGFIYPEILEKMREIDADFTIDGEVITIDGKFNSLQHRSNLSNEAKIESARKQYPIVYMVFDILYLNGVDLRYKPLKERVRILNSHLLHSEIEGVRFVRYMDIDEALRYAKDYQLEGIVIKDMNSVYEGRRSKSWLKLKLFKEAEFRAVRYDENNAGIRVEDKDLNAVQIAGRQSEAVKFAIDEKGYCDIVVQYLEKTKDDRYRFISFKEIRGKENEY